jgi:hypothetical protein
MKQCWVGWLLASHPCAPTGCKPSFAAAAAGPEERQQHKNDCRTHTRAAASPVRERALALAGPTSCGRPSRLSRPSRPSCTVAASVARDLPAGDEQECSRAAAAAGGAGRAAGSSSKAIQQQRRADEERGIEPRAEARSKRRCSGASRSRAGRAQPCAAAASPICGAQCGLAPAGAAPSPPSQLASSPAAAFLSPLLSPSLPPRPLRRSRWPPLPPQQRARRRQPASATASSRCPGSRSSSSGSSSRSTWSSSSSGSHSWSRSWSRCRRCCRRPRPRQQAPAPLRPRRRTPCWPEPGTSAGPGPGPHQPHQPCSRPPHPSSKTWTRRGPAAAGSRPCAQQVRRGALWQCCAAACLLSAALQWLPPGSRWAKAATLVHEPALAAD